MDFHKILSRLTALEGASSKKLNESIEIHADGAEAMALLGHADAGVSSPDPIAPVDDFGMGDDDGIGALDAPMDEPEMGPPDLTSVVPGDEGSGADISDLQRLSGIEPEVAEEAVYANTPDEDIMPLAAAIPSGNDLHKEKGSWLKASGGDNPRGVVASLESKLMKSLKDYLKESEDKPKGEYYAEKDGDDWCVFHTEKSKCFASFSDEKSAKADAAKRNKTVTETRDTSDDEDDKKNSLRPWIDHTPSYGKDKNKVGKPAKGVDDNKLRATKN